MSYTVVYEKSIAGDIQSLSSTPLKSIKKAIDARITTHPLHYGKPLRHSLKGHRRIRTGDYRIIYRVDEKAQTVYVVAIGLGRDLYED